MILFYIYCVCYKIFGYNRTGCISLKSVNTNHCTELMQPIHTYIHLGYD